MKKLLVTPEGTFEVELTNAEIAQKEQDAIQSEQNRIAREEKIATEIANKQSALNKLKALGLNDAEIKSIIG
jgi:DNA repair ATPase RecN